VCCGRSATREGSQSGRQHRGGTCRPRQDERDRRRRIRLLCDRRSRTGRDAVEQRLRGGLGAFPSPRRDKGCRAGASLLGQHARTQRRRGNTRPSTRPLRRGPSGLPAGSFHAPRPRRPAIQFRRRRQRSRTPSRATMTIFCRTSSPAATARSGMPIEPGPPVSVRPDRDGHGIHESCGRSMRCRLHGHESCADAGNRNDRQACTPGHLPVDGEQRPDSAEAVSLQSPSRENNHERKRSRHIERRAHGHR
jgi:hypothetical protein